jgi:hypothetical protein
MKRRLLIASLSLALGIAVNAKASDPIFQRTDGSHGLLYSGTLAAKAARDTTFLLGGPDALTGKFQDQYGLANWQGWTHYDQTYSGDLRWNVDTFNVPPDWGTYAMWCGQRGFPDCGAGYGNNWNENLVFTYVVANPSTPTTVRLECKYNVDSEEGWDWFDIQQNQGGSWVNLLHTSGNHPNQRFEQNVIFQPGHYVGDGNDELQFRLRCTSDDNTSDEDCQLNSNGFAQVDNIRVVIQGSVPVTFYEDHEDGVNDYWFPVVEPNVGDFAKIWTNLSDLDPCITNPTPQVAFLDDGVVVPGTGGSPCATWCYGPSGYILNCTGGLAGPAFHLQNLLVSPVLNWPAGADGAILTFTAYRHEEQIQHVSPGIYYQWGVRSATDAAHLAYAPWQDRNYVYYGGPDYIRNDFVVTDLLEPGRTVVQISLRCVEYGWIWGYDGVDGTPAPYLDNVVFKVFPFEAPAISARDIDLANDSFPARGDIDLVNLANNSIRFDMARSIAPAIHRHNDPGDSIFVDIGLPRAGSVLNGMPKLVVKMRANPLFDAVRVLPAGFTQAGRNIDGWVYGDSTFNAGGALVANRYHFDLPDSHFFYPGDVIHYYILAQDNLNGDIGTATLPADISAVGQFEGIFPYGGNSTFIVRGLPTLFDLAGHQPEILFWNDFANRGGENEWYFALNNLGYNEHLDYDVYYTNGPSSGVGNGLGGRATSQAIGGYDVLLYTSGDLTAYTLSNGDYANDPSRDLAVLDGWFQAGDKKAFMTGDDLAYSLTVVGGEGLDFLATYLGVTVDNNDLRPAINNQTAPRVRPTTGNSLFTTAGDWIAYGGCPGINHFDAIHPTAGAERLARFLTPGGIPGYSYAAAVRKTDIADVVLLPYDFSVIYNPADYVPSHPGYAARTEVLRDVLIEFGKIPQGTVIDVPDGDLVFGVSNYPNPFNPVTEIRLVLPHAGKVGLKIYSVRGELVRTLVDGELAAGVQKLPWNGADDAGRPVASGVYFSEARYAGETSIKKMALVR